MASIRLNRQVENILNMSRLDSGFINAKWDWCDMDELIHLVIQKIGVVNEHQIIYNTNEALPLFKIDIGFTEQILFNILYNAVQYTPAGTKINIKINHELECCVVEIDDDGPGIPESDLNFIFDKFYRISNSKPGGSGLGLSIVKGFVEAQNGTIHAENKIDGGLKLTIKIPTQTSYLNKLKNE